MSVRFKFRSSATFDSINLNGLHSISVRDLRTKIISQNKLQICKDFDLDISDADTGKVFDDENFQVKAGSSIVIKRVPAGSKVPYFVNAKPACAPKEDADEDLDDFGVDLYANIHGSSLFNSCNDVGKSGFIVNEEVNVFPSLPKQPTLICKNSEGSEISEARSKEIIGDNCCKVTNAEEVQNHIKSDPDTEVQPILKEKNASPQQTTPDIHVPPEYSCSLCAAIIKQAVLIPCCQYSFCEKCIQSTLLERRKCPKCSSMKCTVDSLLPNLTLRQAIKHFIDTQANNFATEVKITQCIPDEESGIQGKPASLPNKLKQKKMDDKSSGHTEVLNSLKMAHNFLPEEDMIASTAPQNDKGIGITVLDGTETYMPSSKHRKGERNCFMCGSPTHLIRDCPQAAQSYPLKQTEGNCFNGGMPMYGNHCWNVNPFSQGHPYMNMYGNPGMMPYNAAPISPFGITPYMPPMCTDMQSPFGYMRMGAMPYPVMAEAKWYGPQFGEQKHKIVHSVSEHDDIYQGRQINSRHQLEDEDNESPSNSEGRYYVDERHKRVSHQSFSGKDERHHRSKNTNSESQEYSKDRKKDRYRKRPNEEKEKTRKDFSEDDDKAIMSHRRNNYRHHNYSEHKHQMESETSHSSKSSRHKTTKRSSYENSRNERLEMVDGSTDDESRGVKCHKHRRA